MRSTNVDQVFTKMTDMFLGLSRTSSRTFGRSKIVSNILIGCLITSDKIKSPCDFVDFAGKLWIYTQTQKMLTLSEAMKHPMRMFDTILELPKVPLKALESPRNIPVILVNTWSTSAGLIVA